MQKDMGLYVGCISGASMVNEYEDWLKEAGFTGYIAISSQLLFKTDVKQTS